MTDNLEAALRFAALAKGEQDPAVRKVFLAAALAFRMLAISDGRRFIAELPKRPAAASVRRIVKRKRA